MSQSARKGALRADPEFLERFVVLAGMRGSPHPYRGLTVGIGTPKSVRHLIQS
ncbi:MAG: hypothetical protein R2941_17165 [Desulfobacterales bacterium]